MSASRPPEGSAAPSNTGEQAFGSRRERRAYEEAQQAARDAAAGTLQANALSETQGAADDVRAADARLDEARRSTHAARSHRVQPVEAAPQTGRVRVRTEGLAGVQPGVSRASASAASARLASASRRRIVRPAPVAAPKRRRKSALARVIAKVGIMVTAIGMVATTAVPAYARLDVPTVVDIAAGRAQTLAVGTVQSGSISRDNYGAHTQSAALDSTLGTVVAPEVQALAQQLMTAVAQGRLVGSTPDHIPEIRYLAEGQVVPDCGIDYRVLQTIAFALTKFNSVGVSDINRLCTGQIEGAGVDSPHYTNGGGHAVDFYLLNGQSLTGGDPASLQLIEDLDAVVPTDSTVGQEECRSSMSFAHFQQIDDTCNHVHIDFGNAEGTSLLGS
ncbi:hypothetical protein [Humibacter sp. RRB41]|uniref:hypothetical protein n=1 Tax=Humibacter sp. RRB41 TaxID=2919946 RepID=UPI001FA94E79|nr:hypothetical protein [Humibacter sp. RRB41]